jgi:hypothetical protein
VFVLCEAGIEFSNIIYMDFNLQKVTEWNLLCEISSISVSLQRTYELEDICIHDMKGTHNLVGLEVSLTKCRYLLRNRESNSDRSWCVVPTPYIAMFSRMLQNVLYGRTVNLKTQEQGCLLTGKAGGAWS